MHITSQSPSVILDTVVKKCSFSLGRGQTCEWVILVVEDCGDYRRNGRDSISQGNFDNREGLRCCRANISFVHTRGMFRLDEGCSSFLGFEVHRFPMYSDYLQPCRHWFVIRRLITDAEKATESGNVIERRLLSRNELMLYLLNHPEVWWRWNPGWIGRRGGQMQNEELAETIRGRKVIRVHCLYANERHRIIFPFVKSSRWCTPIVFVTPEVSITQSMGSITWCRSCRVTPFHCHLTTQSFRRSPRRHKILILEVNEIIYCEIFSVIMNHIWGDCDSIRSKTPFVLLRMSINRKPVVASKQHAQRHLLYLPTRF